MAEGVKFGGVHNFEQWKCVHNCIGRIVARSLNEKKKLMNVILRELNVQKQ